MSDIPKVETGGHWGDSETGYAYLAGELRRERDQARSLACEYASRLAEIERLLREMQESDRFVPSSSPAVAQRIGAALAVASGAALQVPLRVLVEWALRGREWEQEFVQLGDMRVLLWTRPDDDSVFGGRQLASAVSVQIECEEAAPAAEATT